MNELEQAAKAERERCASVIWECTIACLLQNDNKRAATRLSIYVRVLKLNEKDASGLVDKVLEESSQRASELLSQFFRQAMH